MEGHPCIVLLPQSAIHIGFVLALHIKVMFVAIIVLGCRPSDLLVAYTTSAK